MKISNLVKIVIVIVTPTATARMIVAREWIIVWVSTVAKTIIVRASEKVTIREIARVAEQVWISTIRTVARVRVRVTTRLILTTSQIFL